MICSRCGYDHSKFISDNPRFCIRCGERLEEITKDEINTALSVDEVAKMFGLTKGSVYQYVKRGILPAFHIGKTLRFDKRTLEEIKGGK